MFNLKSIAVSYSNNNKTFEINNLDDLFQKNNAMMFSKTNKQDNCILAIFENTEDALKFIESYQNAIIELDINGIGFSINNNVPSYNKLQKIIIKLFKIKL